MNKKFLGVLLASLLVLSQAVVAFAAPSSNTGVTSGDKGTTIDANVDLSGIKSSEVKDIISSAMNGTATDAQIVSVVNKTGNIITTTADFVTPFIDVRVPVKSSDGFYHATMEVANLPANASTANVRGLHYSTARAIWEVLTPVSVNGSSVEFALVDCSPVAVYVTSAATSPATGVSTSWTLFMGAAVVFFAVSAIASKKANR